MDVTSRLAERIGDGSARVCVLGLGYVGLPLAIGFATVGYVVDGIDIDGDRVRSLNEGRSYIPDVDSSEVAQLCRAGRFRAHSSTEPLDAADVIFICVPTPFTKAKVADISFIQAAARTIAQHLRSGQLVILQSTTHPGTTEEDVLPILEGSGLRAGHDFHLAFCPERINPGDRTHTVLNTPKVIGGLTAECSALARGLFERMTPQVKVVSSPRAAEMSKLLENIFRSVNIAMVNELAKLCERMGIDLWEVIDAASTKPFGFIPFFPGAGVGGHCIAVDPYYLSWKAREYDFYTKFIELAAEVNQSMPYHLVSKIVESLNRQGKALAGARILVLGVAFKRDIDDSRNSPAERVIEIMADMSADICYNDPYVPEFTVGSNPFLRRPITLTSTPLTDEILEGVDCVAIVSGHSVYDYQWIVDRAAVVVDSCNATKNVQRGRTKITRIGAPVVDA